MVQKISAKQANALLSTGTIEVIDVREPREWLTGHIDGSQLVPLGTFRHDPKAAVHGNAVLFVCAAGVRSETAARLASLAGVQQVYNLVGGIRAWLNAGFPLTQQAYESTAAE